MIGIYKITCKTTNKVYIGQSVDINYRFSQYKFLNCVKNQRKIYNSLKKYGYTNHIFEVLEVYDFYNQKLITEREQYFIDYYKNCGYVLLNIKDAGSCGKHDDKTKRKIGESNKLRLTGRKLSEQHVENIKKSLINNKRRLGTKHSIETKEKMKNSHVGKKKTLEHSRKISESKKKKIQQYTLDKKLINEFDCANDAAEKLNFKSAKHIRSCASGIKKSAYGFIWKYKN